jgi:hypothetical protein
LARKNCAKGKKSLKAIADKGKTAKKLATNYAGWIVGWTVGTKNPAGAGKERRYAVR